MFKSKQLEKIERHVSMTLKTRRERRMHDEARERVMNEQRIRHEIMTWLSVNNMLKDGVS